MKQHFIVILAVLCAALLIVASAVSIGRAKRLPVPQEDETGTQPGAEDQTQGDAESGSVFETESESPTQEDTEKEDEEIGGMAYVTYTGDAHAGTGIAYRGSGENAKYVIVIDAGHQQHGMSETEPNGPGSDVMKAKVTGGTQGSTTGLAEHALNLRVALALRDVLVAQGYTVVMVRETAEVEISNAERAQMANAAGADVNIRIHANGDTNTSVKGAMAVCQTPQNPYNANIYEECRALSDALLQAFCAGTGMTRRSVWETDTMTGTNWATVPTTIIEMGFMTNAEDEGAMAAEGFAAKAAKGLADGIAAYLARSDSEQTTDGASEIPPYTVDLELEASFGKTFTEVYVTVQATGNVWVRTEPSSEKGMATAVRALKPGERVICVGYGENWNRVLIDGKVYYVSAAYLQEVEE